MVEEQEECPCGQSGQEKYTRQGEKDGRGQIIADTMLRCLDSCLSIVGSLWITLKPKSNVILVGRRLKTLTAIWTVERQFTGSVCIVQRDDGGLDQSGSSVGDKN